MSRVKCERYAVVKWTSTIVVCGFLLFLFIVPRLYVSRLCGRLSALSAQAAACALSEQDAGESLVEMERTFEVCAPKLRLFIDHASVDAVGACLAACQPLTEREALLAALNELDVALLHLSGIEGFALANLL